MNLLEMAQFVCAKARHQDAASITLCKQFINQRYQMIYDAELWRDSLFLKQVTVDPTTDPRANAGILQLGAFITGPTNLIDKIIAVRQTDRQLYGDNVENLFRGDLDQFAQTGQGIGFYTLPPAVWDFGTISDTFYPSMLINGQLAIAATTATADVGVKLQVGLEYVGGFSEIQMIGSATGAGNFLGGDIKAILSLSKPVTNSSINIIAGTLLNSTVVVILTPQDQSALGSATNAPRLKRIRLYNIPTAATTYKILVKKKGGAMASDYDTPDLESLDNCLCAFAQGDMLQRAMAYDMAQLCYKEGAGLLEQYKRREVYQQANNPQVLPYVEPMLNVDGYGGGLTKGGYFV